MSFYEQRLSGFNVGSASILLLFLLVAESLFPLAMLKFMSSLSFPDVNVWLALTLGNHVHRGPALDWWNRSEGTVAFLRITQLSLLRLLTTSAAMDGKPLSPKRAWAVYDKFFNDDRVVFLGDPIQVETEFRIRSSSGTASPKIWADAFLVASVMGHGGQLVTFDKAIQSAGGHCILL